MMDPFSKYGNHWKSSTLALSKTESHPMEVIIFPSKLPQNDGPVHREWAARHRNAKSLSRPYPMSRQCQPTTEDMTWKWLSELEYDLSNICENQDSDPHPWIHLFQLDTMALRVSSWHATVLRGCPNNWHVEGFGVPNAAARKHVATSQPCRLAKKQSFSEIHFPTPIHSYKTLKNTYV